MLNPGLHAHPGPAQEAHTHSVSELSGTRAPISEDTGTAKLLSLHTFKEQQRTQHKVSSLQAEKA